MPPVSIGARFRLFARGLACCLSIPLLTAVAAEPVPTAPPPAPALLRKQREERLTRQLTGSTFVGQFNIAGRAAATAPQSERYTLSKVTKLPGDAWMFEARIQYGTHDVSVPIVLDVFWADDTPVISLTNLAIPKLGSFTSRVLIHGDRYAGTWQHGTVGGHLWGVIEPAAPREAHPPAAPPNAAPKKP